ncbi:hypothetical protein OAT16_09960 [Prolixibacteraceae bacterium]|nr:hypothetical protein [Prolixibacteraceae bacterium]
MQIDFLLNDTELLEDVSLNDIMGGVSLESYNGGCPNKDHQVVETTEETSLY